MYVEVDFGKLESVSGVAVESSDDAGDVKMKLEGCRCATASGSRFPTIPSSPGRPSTPACAWRLPRN